MQFRTFGAMYYFLLISQQMKKTYYMLKGKGSVHLALLIGLLPDLCIAETSI